MSNETCNCPCCQQGIEAPHEYHLERRPMPIRDFLGRPAPEPLQAFLRALDCDPVAAVAPMSGMEAFDKALGSLLAHIDPDGASGVQAYGDPREAWKNGVACIRSVTTQCTYPNCPCASGVAPSDGDQA